jgi:hypothetical protein
VMCACFPLPPSLTCKVIFSWALFASLSNTFINKSMSFAFLHSFINMSKTKRCAYDADYKLKAIDRAKTTSNRKAAFELGINESMIRKWRRKDQLLPCLKQQAFRGQVIVRPVFCIVYVRLIFRCALYGAETLVVVFFKWGVRLIFRCAL